MVEEAFRPPAARQSRRNVEMAIYAPVALALLFGLSVACTREHVHVAGGRCDAEQLRQVEELAASGQSWGQLHDMFARFAARDDGATAEGFSESVTVLLAERWDQLSQLASIAARDPAFETFVVRHI